MTIFRPIQLAALMLLMLAGCATQIRSGDDLAAHVAQQISEHRYGAAVLSIDDFASSNVRTRQVDQLRGDVSAAAARFEAATINTAEKKVAQGDWHAAQLIYRRACYSYPESTVLGAAETDFTARRDAHVEHLRIVQYAEKARYLNAEIAQLEQINAATPFDLDTKRELARQRDQQKLIASALQNAGERQLTAKNYSQARDYLTLSNNLISNAATQAALRKIPPPVKQRPEKIKATIKPAPVKTAAPALIARPDSNIDVDEELKQAMAAYYTAREQGDLLLAQRHLGQALSLQPGSNELVVERGALNAAVQQRVQEKLENGKYLYSMGEVDAAIIAWQIAAALAPGDQALQQRLERAQKFRKRYEELKK